MPDNGSTGNSEPSAATPPYAPTSDAAITALANRVATARGKLPLQSDPALFAELSEAEITAERDLAEWMRKQRRRQRRQSVTAELTAEKRDRRVALALRRADEADARWHRRALAARRRVSNPDARLAQLYRRAEWSSRALIGVVVLGMLWAGVNVQHNLVPSGNMSDPLYWLSYGFEAMISIPIITIMVVATTAARWGREIARGKVVFLETALLGVTIALNAGPHLAAGRLAGAAEAAVAPVMVGVVIWLHAWVSARYAQLIDAIPAEGDLTPDEPARQYPRTTVEFGAPCTTTFAEFTPGTTESAALPIGHTAQPATGLLAGAVGQFDAAAAHFGDGVAQFATTGRQTPHRPTGDERPPTTTEHPVAHDHNNIPLEHDDPHDTEHSAPTADPTRDTGTASAHDTAPEHVRAAIVNRARDAVSEHQTRDSIAEPNTGTKRIPDAAEHAANTEHTPDNIAEPTSDTVSEHIPDPTTQHTRTSATEGTHSAAPATESPRGATRPATPGRGTQLVLDEQAPQAPVRRRPHVVADPTPVPSTRISREFADVQDTADAPDTWDDSDDIAAEIDDAEVWAMAREIAARRLSKLPVEQLAEVLTLADASWTPAAIGASIGLPGSRILGILETARRIRRTVA